MSEQIELNKNGVNKKIKANILPYEEMKKIDFTDFREGFWSFSRLIAYETTFNITINKDNTEDLSIDILDENFCQPYDYQNILENNQNNKFALEVKEKVEYWMRYLQDKGVLSGHVYGEYI